MKVTTIRGHQAEFDPNAIKLVTGPTKKDKNPCVRILGVFLKAVKVSQDAEKFIEGLPNKANFVKLRFAKGGNFWANAALITNIQVATEGDLVQHPLAQAIINFGKMKRFISDDVDTAKTKINAAGGKL